MNSKARRAETLQCNRARCRTFVAITRTYRRLHEEAGILKTGLYRLTAQGAWASSRAPHVFFFFRKLRLHRYRCFLDLGSGDGMVVCLAGLFTRALGIEIDPELCGLAQRAARDLGVAALVGFVCGDYRQLPIHRADCLYCYPDKPLPAIADRLRTWRGDLLVYGPHFPPPGFAAITRLACGRERLVLYRSADEG